MNKRLVIVAAGIALTMSACSREQQEPSEEGAAGNLAEEAVASRDCPTADSDGIVEIQPGLIAKIVKQGYGRAARSKDYADVHTTLWLYDESADGGRGQEIWSSGGTNPFQFQIDAGQVIAGWDLGVTCMLVGEKRELRIPPELGYGARGKPPVPPNATLLFEIELAKLTAPD
jgi:FKBP-type peptidyl-prolyl cis-trans isomerase